MVLPQFARVCPLLLQLPVPPYVYRAQVLPTLWRQVLQIASCDMLECGVTFQTISACVRARGCSMLAGLIYDALQSCLVLKPPILIYATSPASLCSCILKVADYCTLCMQLVERRQGNVRYKRRHFTEALEHYSKAASMLEGLSGRAEEEQQEVDANLGSVYLNIAAVHLQQQYYGEAVKWCTKALKLNRSNDRALLRRAKAHMGRHNYQVTHDTVSTCIVHMSVHQFEK